MILSRIVRRRLLVVSAVLPSLVLLPAACSRQANVTIMSYNVQNLFDGVSDGTEYAAFDPARGRWDEPQFRRRCKRVAEVIRRAAPRGPDIVCLQEVENGAVVETLRSRYLADFGYRYLTVTETAGAPVNAGSLSARGPPANSLLVACTNTRASSRAAAPYGSPAGMRVRRIRSWLTR